jgi:Protein of unknown function (DUF4231)
MATVTDASPPTNERSSEPRPSAQLRRWWRSQEARWLDDSWEQLAQLVEELELEGAEKRMIRLRWFDESRHYDRLWRAHRRPYYVLRTLTITGATATAFLAALEVADVWLQLAGFTAALSAALEGIFGFGDRWRHQRRTAMALKAEGLRFIELRPPYRIKGGHAQAYPDFIDRLERLNEEESEVYLALFARDADEKTKEAPHNAG